MEIDDPEALRAQPLDVGALVLHPPLHQDLEQRIVPLGPRALAAGLAHLQGGAMAAAEEVRKVRRGEREPAVHKPHPLTSSRCGVSPHPQVGGRQPTPD